MVDIELVLQLLLLVSLGIATKDMGRKGKQGYDLFDEVNPATSVQLPQLDPRQPEQAHRPQTFMAKADDSLKNCKGRSHPPSTLSRSELTEEKAAKKIRVKLPRFTHNTDHLTTNILISASSSAHRKRKSGKTFTSAKAPVKASSSLHLARPLVRVPCSTKCRSPGRKVNFSYIKANRKSKAAVSSRSHSSHLKATSDGSVRLQGRRKAAMKAARAHYREEKAKNRGNIDNAVTAPTATPTDLSSVNTPPPAVLTPKPKLKSSARTDLSSANTPPAVSTPKPEPKSSTKLWNDYAARTSAGPSRPSTHPSHIVRPRGQKMLHHPSSPHRRSGAAAQRQYGGPIARRFDDWRSWVEVRVNLKGLTPDIGTYEIARSFYQEGKIGVIEIFEDSSGSRTGKAKITFR